MNRSRTIIEDVNELQKLMQEWRRDIHKHPELAFNELRTSKLVASRLKKMGIKVKKNVGKLGVLLSLETTKLKIRTCSNHVDSYKFYFRTILNTKQVAAEKAEYVIMTDRNLRYRKKNCFQLFKGEDIVSVKKLGLTLSTFRKINSNEAQEYMTHEWRLKNESWYVCTSITIPKMVHLV